MSVNYLFVINTFLFNSSLYIQLLCTSIVDAVNKTAYCIKVYHNLVTCIVVICLATTSHMKNSVGRLCFAVAVTCWKSKLKGTRTLLIAYIVNSVALIF